MRELDRRGFILGGCVAALVPCDAFSQIRRIPTVDEIRSRDEKLWRLVDDINAYRRTMRLAPIPLSPKLTAVAAKHVKDLADNAPHKTHGSLHSWSESPLWKGGPFRASDPKTHALMWDKPREIAGYESEGFEIAASGIRDASHALDLWKTSGLHHDVIINRGIWKDFQWKALGAVVHKGFACAWFGTLADG